MTNNTDAQIAREWARRAVESAENAQPVSRGELAAARHVLATTTPPTMADVEWDSEVHSGLCAEHCDGYEVLMLGKESWDDDRIYCRWTVHGEVFFGPIHKLHLTPIPGTKVDLTPRRTHAETVTAASIEDYKSGRVVDFDDKTLLPRPEDVPVGEVWEVEAVGYGKWAGTRSNPGNTNSPWTLIRVDSCDYYWAKDDQVTLVRRLVPESTPDHPTELTTWRDYRSAPEGTIVAQDEGKPFVLIGEWWRSAGGWAIDHGDMSGIRRRVLRWGVGSMTRTFADEVRTQSTGETIVSWDDPNLEPDRDPVDARMVPCVVCMSSPQVGGTGVCSPECEADLEEWIKKDEDDWNL